MLAVDRLNEMVDQFMQIHKGNQVNTTEMDEKNSVGEDNARTMPNTGQPTHKHTQITWTY